MTADASGIIQHIFLIQLLVIIHLLLKRNPELYFPDNIPLDMDRVSITFE